MEAKEEIKQKILDRLEKQVAFGGLTRRKTVAGEVILECPVIDTSGEGSLELLASDLTSIFLSYIEKASYTQIKSIVKGMLE